MVMTLQFKSGLRNLCCSRYSFVFRCLEHVELHLIDSYPIYVHLHDISVTLLLISTAVKYLPMGEMLTSYLLLRNGGFLFQSVLCLTTLTLKHKNGCQQKVVIVAAHEATTIPHACFPKQTKCLQSV